MPSTRRGSVGHVLRAALILALASATVAVGAPNLALAKSTKGNKADIAMQKQGVLTAADFPAGWISTSVPPGVAFNLPAGTGTACADQRAVDAALSSSATESPLFQSPDRLEGGINRVAVVKSAATAKSYLKAYGMPSAVQCVQTWTQEEFKSPQVLSTQITVSQRTGAPSLGADDGVAFGVDIKYTDTSLRDNVAHADLVMARVGRSVVQFYFQASPAATPHDQQVKAAIGRLKAAGA